MRKTLSFKIFSASILVMSFLFALESGVLFLMERSSVMREMSLQMIELKDRMQASMTQPVWALATDQVKVIVELELRSENLVYIVVRDERGRILYGLMKGPKGNVLPYDEDEGHKLADSTYYTDLSHERRSIGSVEIGGTKSHTERILFERFIQVVFRSLVVVLIGLLMVVLIIKVSVATPLERLYVAVRRFADKDFYVRAEEGGDDEIGDLSKAFNGMADTIHEYSRNLERQVAARTRQLLESEKMAFLGSLVAGVAHEINTPVGIGVTAASHVQELLTLTEREFMEGTLSKSAFEERMRELGEAASILQFNLLRASDLVRSFKQIAVDQSNEECRTFRLGEYIEEIVFSLRPKLRKTPHSLRVECDPAIAVTWYPGMLSQIFTNLIVNSLYHGLDPGKAGIIRIAASVHNESVVIEYSDDGRGIPKANLPKIFLPFFTTGRESGGTGLGLYMIYNIVTKTGGSIRCASEEGRGVTFTIQLPDGVLARGGEGYE